MLVRLPKYPSLHQANLLLSNPKLLWSIFPDLDLKWGGGFLFVFTRMLLNITLEELFKIVLLIPCINEISFLTRISDLFLVFVFLFRLLNLFAFCQEQGQETASMDMSVFLKLQQRVRNLEKEKKQLQDMVDKNEDNNRNISSTTADELQVTNNQVNSFTTTTYNK